VTVLSEERHDTPVADGDPWIVLDPPDGTGNFAAGMPPWDGVPIAPRPGTTVVLPSAPSGGTVRVPGTVRRVRVTGCTAVDLCLVADGSAAAWHDVDRSGTQVHDVAGGLAVVLAAGGVVLTPHGGPLFLRPDTETRIRFVAAPDEDAARELLAAPA
jgi:3'(2'), 5'-bisphosphate nucleotidase